MLLQSGCLNACSEPQTRALPRQAAAATSTPKSAKPELAVLFILTVYQQDLQNYSA